MPAEAWRVLPLAGDHRRADFDCGEENLNEYLRRHVAQDARRHLTHAFVPTSVASMKVLRYYTLSATSIQRERFPAAQAKKLPRYPIPAVLLSRLAIDVALRGQRLGEHLLVDALKRVGRASATIGVHTIVVDAINERAARYYAAYGFVRLTEPVLTLFLPIESV